MTRPDSDLKTHLLTRRTVPAAKLAEPAPDEAELATILTAASRVPDHGKLVPWRFVVMSGEARRQFVDRLMDIWARNNPDASPEAADVERGKRAGAPLVVTVICRAGEHPKIPVWEQELAVGAACMNLLHATHAAGYSAQWLTGWPAYDEDVYSALGLGDGERIAGFVHIGTPEEAPVERDRPDLTKIVTIWGE